MPARSSKEITQLLVAWSDGDESALAELTPLVYEELRRLAHHYMSGERKGHTLQTTALVNEAYVRLIDWKNVRWQNRAHFFGVSAQLMRRILNYAAAWAGKGKTGPTISLISRCSRRTTRCVRILGSTTCCGAWDSRPAFPRPGLCIW
jgi:ECF sigma factor